MDLAVADRSSSIIGLSLVVPLAALPACIGDPVPYYREAQLSPAGNPECIEAAIRHSIPGQAVNAFVRKQGTVYRWLDRPRIGRIETRRAGDDFAVEFLPYEKPTVLRYLSDRQQTGLAAMDREVAKRCQTKVEVKKETCYRGKCP